VKMNSEVLFELIQRLFLHLCTPYEDLSED